MNAKNASFLFVLAIVVMMIATPALAANANRSAQMMAEPNVPPSVLADRIDRECKENGVVNGACKPSGANTTVDGFVTAINANPEGKRYVASAQELPKFLRALKKGPFIGELCLSGVHQSGEVAAYCKVPRGPHPGEGAWWMGNNLVLAEDCLNSVVTYKPVDLETVQVRGRSYNPVVRARTEPFASQRRTVSAGCSLGDDRYFGVMVFEAAAARHECAVRTMLPFGGRLGERKGGGISGTYHDPDRFSRTCGAVMRGAVKAGEFNLSSIPHRFEVLIQNGDQETVLGTFTVIGNKITADDEKDAGLVHESGQLIYLPEEYTTGDLVIRYLEPNGLRTPTASGTGERVENIKRGCKVGAFYAIDADGSNQQGSDIAFQN